MKKKLLGSKDLKSERDSGIEDKSPEKFQEEDDDGSVIINHKLIMKGLLTETDTKPFLYWSEEDMLEQFKKHQADEVMATDEAICSLSLPKKEFKESFQKCAAGNSEEITAKSGRSVLFPKEDSDNYKAKMKSKNSEIGTDLSMDEMRVCPHCFYYIPIRRFENHRKYCRHALRVCSFCEDTYHIDEDAEHKRTCDATDYVLKPENGSPIKLQKTEVFPSEEAMTVEPKIEISASVHPKRVYGWTRGLLERHDSFDELYAKPLMKKFTQARRLSDDAKKTTEEALLEQSDVLACIRRLFI